MSYFQFEADFVDSLRCIPMRVRYKLDTSGIKLKLHHWHQLTQTERQQLVDLPCDSKAEILDYRDTLQALVVSYCGSPAPGLPVEPHPAWLDPTRIPDSVQTKAKAAGVALPLEQWANLSPLQRFALIKLSRSGHENRNFVPALREFCG
ncbi:MAG: nitrate reductase maturation protein NarM [Synechococcaceae cyanobacterium SM2_3_1]|nr:nitrate reductase maturation protein NarM [Synechococcaceae cyanobacterium SM2_3_1]